jgi:hypothetical protein
LKLGDIDAVYATPFPANSIPTVTMAFIFPSK